MYKPPFTLSAKAVNLIAEISALLEYYKIQESDEQELRLRKANRIKTIHSSLAIEGNTLSVDEVADIINGKTVVAPIREVQEVKNAIKVYDAYETFNPFKEKDLLRAHGIMMEALMDNPGKYRSGGVGVYGDKGLIHMAPPASRVPELMGDLFGWLTDSDDHLLIRSCVFHYEFEFIHPFMDGNGRTGRLWQSLILGRLNPVFSHLPVENMVYSNQEAYYDAIAESTKLGESGPFIDFILTEIAKTLREKGSKVPSKVSGKVPSKSENEVLKILLLTPGATRKVLAEKTGMSESGIKKLLSRMKAEGWISREGSDKTGIWKVLIEID